MEEPLDVQLSRLDKDTAADFATIEIAEEGAKGAIQGFNAAADSVRRHVIQSVSSMAQSMRFYFWTVFAFWAAGGIGIGYELWIFSTPMTVGFVVFWFAVGLVVLWNVRSKQSALDEGEKMLARYSRHDDDNNDSRGNPTLSLPQELASTRSLSKTIQNAIEKVAGTAALLTPKLKQIVDLRTVKLKQEHFIDGFAYSLSHYNLGLDYSEVQSMLSKRFWAYEDETYWLGESIKEVRKVPVNVSAPILKLIYYDSMNEDDKINPIWQEICDSVTLRKEFALLLIQKKLLDARTINESSAGPLSELFLGIKKYALATANVRATEFFDGLLKYKTEVVSDLTTYGLEIKDDLQQLADYMQLSTSPEAWRNQVLDFAASLLKESPLIVRLLVRDVEGDQGRLDAWRKIVSSHTPLPDGTTDSDLDILEQFAVVLSRKRISKPFDDFRDDVFRKHLVLTLNSYPDSFSSTRVETQVRLLETQILRVRRNIEAIKRRFRLAFVDSTFLDDFVPSTLHSVEKDLVSAAAALSDVNPKVFEVLYYSFVDPDSADQLFLSLKGKSRKESQLAYFVNFVVSKKFIPSTEPKEHLETLFWTQEAFNLNEFLQISYLYDRLHRSSSALHDFLAENAVLREAAPSPHLGRIVELCPPDASAFENRLVKIAQSLLVDGIGSYQLSISEKEELASAAAAISLKSQGDLSYKPLCMTIASHRLAPRILYEFADVDRINPNSTLRDATQRAMDSGPSDERHFNAFVTQLEMGVLHLRIGNLLEVQLSEATEKITSWQASILAPDQGIAFREAIKDLFTEQINEEIVREFLTQQIVSAYIITDPHNNPLIRLLGEKDSIAEAQNKLAKDHPEFRNLVQIRKGSGKGTRIGIVPFSMPFETFSDKFSQVLQDAIKIYNPKHSKYPIPDTVPDKIPCYLLRIFPSEHGLKEIMSEGELEARPVALVRELMEESIGDMNEIKLLSLVQSAKTGYEGVKSVIRAIVDHDRSSVKSLTGGNITANLKSFPVLSRVFESRKIDKALFSLYPSNSLSEMCTRIAREAGSGSEAAQTSFRTNLETEILELKTLPPAELKSVIGSVYVRLRNIGIGLTV